MSDPPPRLATPKVPEVSAKINSGTGAPAEDLEMRSERFASAGRLRKASRVMRRNASSLRAEDCSEITDFEVSRAAKEIE
jgi:hypothetical protein